MPPQPHAAATRPAPTRRTTFQMADAQQQQHRQRERRNVRAMPPSTNIGACRTDISPRPAGSTRPAATSAMDVVTRSGGIHRPVRSLRGQDATSCRLHGRPSAGTNWSRPRRECRRWTRTGIRSYDRFRPVARSHLPTSIAPAHHLSPRPRGRTRTPGRTGRSCAWLVSRAGPRNGRDAAPQQQRRAPSPTQAPRQTRAPRQTWAPRQMRGGGGEVGARAGGESCGVVDLQAVGREVPRRPDWRQPFSVGL